MARKIVPATEIVSDDLTGQDAPDATQVKISFAGKNYALDLAPATVDALTAFLIASADVAAGKDGASETQDAARRVFGALLPRPRVGSKAASNGDGKREWLRANGYPDLTERGKFSADATAAWDAHLAASKPQEPATA